MSKAQRDKGGRGEREVAKLYRAIGGKYRHARRHAENTRIDSGYDLDGCGADFPEVKNHADSCCKKLLSWINKVMRSTLPHGHWCVWQKANTEQGRKWVVTLEGKRYLELLAIEQEAEDATT